MEKWISILEGLVGEGWREIERDRQRDRQSQKEIEREKERERKRERDTFSLMSVKTPPVTPTPVQITLTPGVPLTMSD